MGYLFDIANKNNDFTYKSLSQLLNNETKKQDIPYSAMFQLTPLCNLKCKMCYARLEPCEVKETGKKLLSFNEWKYYIDSLVEIGVLVLSLTGGECTLHPDFVEIYNYAYDKGIHVGIMTNCTNITNKILEAFKRRPPISVSITIYGSSSETYEKLCGNGKAYFKVLENVDRLLDAGISVGVKYTFTKENIDDYEAVQNFCQEKNIRFNPSNGLINLGKCDENVLKNQDPGIKSISNVIAGLSAKINNISVEEEKKKNVDFIVSKYKYIKENPDSIKYIGCSAGRNTLYINWEGHMLPCVNMDNFEKDPRKNGFKSCWTEMNEYVKTIPMIEECFKCPFSDKCSTCVGNHYRETGEYNKVAPRLCWKRQNPEEAAEIMKRLKDEGLISTDE